MSDISRWDLRSGRVGDNNEVFFMDRSKDGPWVSYGDAVFALDAKDALLREAREVLGACENDFERVRQILVSHLEEPERRAFWDAVRGRDRAATLLLKLNETVK